MGNKYIYPQEQLDFIARHPELTRKELTERINEKFNTNYSFSRIKGICYRNHFITGRNGRFDGSYSWQKGLTSEEFKSHYTKSSYEKMTKNIVDKRIYKIGDTIIRHNTPYIVISTEEHIPLDKRIERKNRYIYKQEYGSIPPKHKIINLDGNPYNLDINNLYCIPSKFIPLINKNHWLTDSRENTLTAIKWCELYYALNK